MIANKSVEERLGLPSASSALEDSLCPGRFQLQKEWDLYHPEPEPSAEPQEGNPDDIDTDAEAGKRIHLLYAGKECSNATQAEIDRAEMARVVDRRMKEQWLAMFDLEPLGEIIEIREQRWWLKNQEDKETYSGQADAVWIRGNKGEPADVLVADLKGLWGWHDPAPINMQIRRYIALIAENIVELGYSELRSASAYLNQPAKTLSPAMTKYDEADIQNAVFEMHVDLALMMDTGAPRKPGPVQCHHCRAKLICPEFESAKEHEILPVIGPAIHPPDRAEIRATVERLTPEAMARFLDWVPALEDACDLAKIEARRRLRNDALSIPGWALKPNSPRSKVEDIDTVFSRFAKEYSVTGREFTALCTITKREVAQLTREKSRLRGLALDEKVQQILEGTTRPIKVNASLEKLK